MDKRVKQEWIKALTSGGYKQGTDALHCVYEESGAKFCCLGVLCDLYAKENGIKWEKSSNTLNRDHGEGELFILADLGQDIGRNMESEEGLLPLNVMAWASLDSDDPSLGDNTLTTLNDVLNVEFDEIAKAIDLNL